MAAAEGAREAMGEAVSKVWSYLDCLAEKNPEEYKRFIDKAMTERREFLDPPRPIFCFTTGIRGKENRTLFVNICKWKRVPVQQDTEGALIPVKGGVLRYLVEDGKKQPNSLLLDVAFNPAFMDSCMSDTGMLEIFLDLILDFIDEYLSMLTDRNLRILSPEIKFKGPEADIFHSLDQSNLEKITRESWMDMEEALLTNLKKGKKSKTGKKGNLVANGLPPLFPWQRGNPGNSHQATPKLIEEMGGSTNNSGSSSKPQKKGKNGGKNNGQKKNTTGHRNKTRSRSKDTGVKSAESGRGLGESGRSLGESEEAESGRGSSGSGGQSDGSESGRSLVEGEGSGSGRSLAEGGESGRGLVEGERVRVVPQNRVVVKEEGGRDMVVVRIKLPEVISVDQITLDGSESDISVSAADTYSLSVPFPFHVNPDLSTSTFNKRSRTLTVKLPALDHEEN